MDWFLQPHPKMSFTNEYKLILNYLTLKTAVKVAQLNQTEIQPHDFALKVQAVQKTNA